MGGAAWSVTKYNFCKAKAQWGRARPVEYVRFGIVQLLTLSPLCVVDTLSWTELQSLGQKQAIVAATSPPLDAWLLTTGHYRQPAGGSLLKAREPPAPPTIIYKSKPFRTILNATFLWGELRMKPAGVPSQSHNLLHVSHSVRLTPPQTSWGHLNPLYHDQRTWNGTIWGSLLNIPDICHFFSTYKIWG